MNRGRHKKSNKEKEFYTQAEILNIIQKELYILLSIYKSHSTYSMQSYYAKAYISSNGGRVYHGIIIILIILQKKSKSHLMKQLFSIVYI